MIMRVAGLSALLALAVAGAGIAADKEPARNGGKDMAQLVHHMAEDELVGWGWNPGGKRTPAPGTQAKFGALFTAWADSGAQCPE
ncbi:hypothetical protein ACNI3R_14500 [Rhizorhabdus sp. FW153]